MKSRIVKKYVKRYIYSLTKGLKQTNTFVQEEVSAINGIEIVNTYANNHTIRNGIVTAEGCKPFKTSQDLLNNIKLTGLKAKEIIDTHKHIYFRLFEIRGNQVRMRIITE